MLHRTKSILAPGFAGLVLIGTVSGCNLETESSNAAALALLTALGGAAPVSPPQQPPGSIGFNELPTFSADLILLSGDASLRIPQHEVRTSRFPTTIQYFVGPPTMSIQTNGSVVGFTEASPVSTTFTNGAPPHRAAGVTFGGLNLGQVYRVIAVVQNENGFSYREMTGTALAPGAPEITGIVVVRESFNPDLLNVRVNLANPAEPGLVVDLFFGRWDMTMADDTAISNIKETRLNVVTQNSYALPRDIKYSVIARASNSAGTSYAQSGLVLVGTACQNASTSLPERVGGQEITVSATGTTRSFQASFFHPEVIAASVDLELLNMRTSARVAFDQQEVLDAESGILETAELSIDTATGGFEPACVGVTSFALWDSDDQFFVHSMPSVYALQ